MASNTPIGRAALAPHKVERFHLAAKMVMPRRVRVGRRLKTTKARLTRKLGVNHHHKMIEGGKPLDPFIALMSCNKLGDLATRKRLYDLLEDAYSHSWIRCWAWSEIAISQRRSYHKHLKQWDFSTALYDFPG